jgi:competence protein ComEC
VGHHGSKTSTSYQFLQKTQPEISLISVGKNNQYGHPSPEVMNTLSDFDIDILRTDQMGTVELITNGKTYWLKE